MLPFSIHLEPLGGMAGDMFVAALLDAFPEYKARVFSDVAVVLPKEAGVVHLKPVLKNGMCALHFSLEALHEKAHPHEHDHAYHTSDHTHGRAPVHDVKSHYKSIAAHIAASPLSAGTADAALAILKIIAKAEAAVHGVSLHEVHFHELAAWDSLMDVVAAGSLIAALSGAKWRTTALPLGSGLVKTQHGLLPVPAPATARILEGFAWHQDGVAGERVTPTGAAILAYLIKDKENRCQEGGVLQKTGYGAGTKNFDALPNVLRVSVFENRLSVDKELKIAPTIVLLQCDLDDMTGEEIGIAADRLRATDGVLDLLLLAAQGKKNRPVTMFQLQVLPEKLKTVQAAILTETSSIGLRFMKMDRVVLPRKKEGDLLKIVTRPNGDITRKLASDVLKEQPSLALRRQKKQEEESP